VAAWFHRQVPGSWLQHSVGIEPVSSKVIDDMCSIFGGAHS
jgi:hypothetical protein